MKKFIFCFCNFFSIILLLNVQAAQTTIENPVENSVSLGIENDLLSGGKNDADYTGGFVLTLFGPEVSRYDLSLDPVLGVIDQWVVPGSTLENSQMAGLQISMQAWTPFDKSSSSPIYNDRPYASLFALTSSRIILGAEKETVWASSLSVGMLGNNFAKGIHDEFHKLIGNGPGPSGYNNQISQGGEPTFRYNAIRQNLIGESQLLNQQNDFKFIVEGSVGYLTEAAIGVSARFGKFSSPWWSMQTERNEFYSPKDSSGDLYLSYGLSFKLRAYNALIQGQFRNSEVTLPRSELETLLGVAWFGVTWSLSNATTLSYHMSFQTAEINVGLGARNYSFGGLYLKQNF